MAAEPNDDRGRAVLEILDTIKEQNQTLLKTIQHQIWLRDRHSPFTREIDSFLLSLLKEPKYANPLRLEHYAFKVFSQNGEDGMIQEVFRRIGVKSRRFIEFGVQTGHQCNTHLLLHLGWSGFWIEGNHAMFRQLTEAFEEAIRATRLFVKDVFLTVDNINSVFETAGFSGEIDLMSVDIDGNDIHLLRALSVHPGTS